MPLSDGTNDEKEEVEPPLGWTSTSDITDVVLYQMHVSPPCVKIRTFLHYYKMPFKTVNGKKKKSAYQKVPAMDAGGRQINDSYIIIKNLVPILAGEPFQADWQYKITYELQLAIEVETFNHKPSATKFLKGFGVPCCFASCIAGFKAPSIASSIKEKNPNLGPSVDVGKQFFEAIGDQKFLGGDKPNQVDLAYFGTLLVFMHFGCETAQDHITMSNLKNWYDGMTQVVPVDDIMKK